MRSRVAYIVTLSALAMLTLLFGYSCTRFAKEENVELSARVMSSCATISEITKDFDAADRVDAVGDMYAGRLTGFGLYDAEAKAIYVSEEMHEELFPDEISAAKPVNLCSASTLIPTEKPSYSPSIAMKMAHF